MIAYYCICIQYNQPWPKDFTLYFPYVSCVKSRCQTHPVPPPPLHHHWQACQRGSMSWIEEMGSAPTCPPPKAWPFYQPCGPPDCIGAGQLMRGIFWCGSLWQQGLPSLTWQVLSSPTFYLWFQSRSVTCEQEHTQLFLDCLEREYGWNACGLNTRIFDMGIGAPSRSSSRCQELWPPCPSCIAMSWLTGRRVNKDVRTEKGRLT